MRLAQLITGWGDRSRLWEIVSEEHFWILSIDSGSWWHRFSVVSDGKEYAYNAGDLGSVPGSGRCPGEGNGYPLQYSCLENSMDRGAWQGHKELDTTEQLSPSLSLRLFSVWVLKKKTKKQKYVCSNVIGGCFGDESPFRLWENQDGAELNFTIIEALWAADMEME